MDADDDIFGSACVARDMAAELQTRDLPGQRLAGPFYARETPTVARALLGQRLVRVVAGHRLSGLICETEAYRGTDDAASHAFRRTPRSAIMFGPAGVAYVYLVYGTHFCLNAVTEGDGSPGAVLIRGIVPQQGLDFMRSQRPGISDGRLADGPGKLCRALDITKALNGADLTTGGELFVEAEEAVAEPQVIATARIGVRGDADALARPWRFVWRQAG